jgi:integrase
MAEGVGFEPTVRFEASVNTLYLGFCDIGDTVDTNDVVTYVVTMASLRRKPNSKFWIACFTAVNGQRAQRSTKTTNRKLALKLADDYEAAAQLRMTEAQVRRVLSDLHRTQSGTALASGSVRSFFDQWVKTKTGAVSESTRVAYKSAAKDFCDFLSDRADLQLLYVTKSDVAAFRDHIAGSRSQVTANTRLKILRVAFQQAWRDGVIDDNPAAKVPLLKVALGTTSRRAFTVSELKSLLAAADNEWKGAILFGVYTGQRLGDITRLRWENIDLATDTLAFTTQKTHRRQILPIAAPLRKWLDDNCDPNIPSTSPIFPALLAQIGKTGRVGALSNQFYNLMSSVGLVASRSHQRKDDGLGRDGRRNQNEISFHSLRHTATSLMKNAGVSPAIVQEFVGHDSKAVSEHYTHIELSSLRKAADALPTIT